MVTCLVVGLNQWKRFTLPFLNSVYRNAPDMNVICVDNGSNPPYPSIEKGLLIRSTVKKSYAGGINIGMKAVLDDWVMIVNNDVLIHKPLVERIANLSPNALHGFYLARKEKESDFTWDYLSGWCLIAHRRLWQAVGKFDEKCEPMYFEDADYSIRAVRAGFDLALHDRKKWGIEHLGKKRHKERRRYMEKHNDERDKIMRYVREKHV